jgi:phosphoribosylformylglycinamidine synthase II
MAAAEWSEHCSYKSSKKYIKLLPTLSTKLALGNQFDAGLIDIGDGLVLTVRIESHNHPSAIEPYGGAATGVGGVIRDILSVGTRPIALMNALRFGNISGASNSMNQTARWLLRNVVRGIADYGNCIGVPTVAGEIEFDESFNDYCLVDVACIGLSKTRKIIPNTSDPGDLLFLVGSSTGRDGILGAAFASTELIREDRSAVQIPDPFLKKILIETILEANEKKCIKSMKDLGGGGLACCLSEASHNLDKGFDIDLSSVILRERGMTPIEILISESQERMLLIVSKENKEVLEQIFKKYEVGYSIIGRVLPGHNIKIRHGSKVIADIPSHVVACAPLLSRKSSYPPYLKKRKNSSKPALPTDLNHVLLFLLGSPNICGRSWVYEQYDSEVGLRTVLKPGESDCAVIRLENRKYVSLSIDGNSRQCYLDPYKGTLGCISEAIRNVICSGASPIGIVDHLQFGKPEDPGVFWTFRQAIFAVRDFCNYLNLPVLGGKVSFYNERNNVAIKPSPVIGAIGVGDDLRRVRKAQLNPGCSIFVIGKTHEELGGSEYYLSYHNNESGKVPGIDFEEDKTNAQIVLRLIANGIVKGVHDCSKGGLAIALAEMAMNGNTGVNVDISLAPHSCKRIDSLMFSESNSRYIIATEKPEELKDLLPSYDRRVLCKRVGEASDSMPGRVQYRNGNSTLVDADLDRLRLAYTNSLKDMVNRQ